MDWIDLAQYRARWLAIVNAVMNESRKMRANSWLAEGLLTSQEGLCSMELVGWLVGYTHESGQRWALWTRSLIFRIFWQRTLLHGRGQQWYRSYRILWRLSILLLFCGTTLLWVGDHPLVERWHPAIIYSVTIVTHGRRWPVRIAEAWDALLENRKGICQVFVPLVLTSLPSVVVHDVGHNRHRSEVACNEEPAWSWLVKEQVIRKSKIEIESRRVSD